MLYCTIQVLSSNSLQNKLENIDTQNLVQQYLQLHDNIKVIKQLIKKYFVINSCVISKVEITFVTYFKMKDIAIASWLLITLKRRMK